METKHTVIKLTHMGEGEIMETEIVIEGRITPSKLSEMKKDLDKVVVRKDDPDEVQEAARNWLEGHGFKTIYHYWEQVWLQ